ncbi:MAG TPA: acyl-CoA dehydratase activase [Dehalococcoidia bacterium]|nr:acyl-CoA dehydratase activase [Dehalococcoidia bacterium]
MIITAGVDVGASTTKAVIVNDAYKRLGRAITRTGANLVGAAETTFQEAIAEAGLTEKDVEYVATTGFGRYTIPFRDVQITDLTAHGQGARFLFPDTRSVIDIGAQSTRAMRIEPTGRVKIFRMNDKCAAGAGTFLVRVARYLELTLDEIGPLAVKSTDPQPISSVCAVLAESEIINHVTAGKMVEDILKGAMLSIASRGLALVKRMGVEPEVTLTGGVGLNPGMVQALEESLGQKINVDPEWGIYAGALGAAVLAQMRLQRLRAQAEAERDTAATT